MVAKEIMVIKAVSVMDERSRQGDRSGFGWGDGTESGDEALDALDVGLPQGREGRLTLLVDPHEGHKQGLP